jgi:hypothetical protein
MRILLYSVFFAVLISTTGCDAEHGAFEDTLPDVYTLTTEAAPDFGGTVFPSGGEYIIGQNIQIEARPAEGYIFDYWEGDLNGNKNPEQLIFSRNRSVTAHFTERDYKLNIEIKGEGSVRETVIERSAFVTVSLTAEADSGWFFDRWEGDLTGNENPVTITIEDNEKSITAVFIEDVAEEYTLTVSVEGEGSVAKDPDRSSYTDGEEVVLTAKPASGWSFKEWRGAISGSNNPGSVVMDQDKSVTAVFEQDEVIGIVVDEVKLYIKEMEMGGARNTKDFKTRNFVLNLPLDGSRFRITHTEIPAGFYDELELEIEKPKKNEDVNDPDFKDNSNRYSLVVKGVYIGEQFIFRSTEDFEIDVDMNPHLEISKGQNTVIAIDIDFEGWFRNSNGEILNPSDSRNKEQINKNIEDSFSDFEDDFKIN